MVARGASLHSFLRLASQDPETQKMMVAGEIFCSGCPWDIPGLVSGAGLAGTSHSENRRAGILGVVARGPDGLAGSSSDERDDRGRFVLPSLLAGPCHFYFCL